MNYYHFLSPVFCLLSSVSCLLSSAFLPLTPRPLDPLNPFLLWDYVVPQHHIAQ